MFAIGLLLACRISYGLRDYAQETEEQWIFPNAPIDPGGFSSRFAISTDTNALFSSLDKSSPTKHSRVRTLVALFSPLAWSAYDVENQLIRQLVRPH